MNSTTSLAEKRTFLPDGAKLQRDESRCIAERFKWLRIGEYG